MVSETGFRNAFMGSHRTIEELRLYGRGMQDVKKYKQILDKQIRLDDNSNASALNISWQAPFIYPVYRQRIIDRLLEMRYEPSVIAVDEPSIEKKELLYLRDKIAATPAAKSLMEQTGIAPDNVTDNALVMSQEEIDQFKALGGYSLAAEIALTEAVAATVDLCRYFPQVHRQIIDDLLDIGFAHAEIGHNPGDRMQTTKYIDPQHAIVPNSNYDDCRDITWGGYVQKVTLAELRAESGFDEDTMLKIAKAYQPYEGNSNFGWDGYQGRRDYASGYTYDRFNAVVLTAYFTACEAESFIAGIHASGSKVFDKVKPSTKLSPVAAEKGFKKVDGMVQNVYKVKWVVGTDFIYSYGVNDVVTRDGVPGDMKADFPIITYRTNQMSLTEACVATIDDLCINTYKKRNIISKMPAAPNIAVNISALEQATNLGNMHLLPQDLLDIYTINGVLFLASDHDFSDFPGQGSQPRPIFEMPNTTLDSLRSIQVDLEMCMNQLRQITGVNEIADGTKVTSNQLASVTDSYNQSSNRALSWLYTANESVQTMIFRQLARRYQAVSASGEMSIKYVPVGADTIQIIKLLPEFALSDFQVIVKPGVDESIKQSLLQSITTYKMNAQISPADEMAVVTMFARGQYRRAQFYLATAVARKAKQDAMMAQQNAAAQAQAQGQAGQMVEQAKAQTKNMEMQQKAQLLELEYRLKNDFQDKEVARKIKLAAATGISDAAISQLSSPNI